MNWYVLWPGRKLTSTIDCPIFNVGDVAINKFMAVAICYAERVRACPHAWVGLHEIVVRGAGHGDPFVIAVEVF